ncbi:MAG: ABC transporter substrate-binding protein [Clostridiales Family XIII bacterium]|jgi:ABC-type nitrate/sulfonate/bicarbonate transport system substrate-binding protein|nr:ABC transporter substrate-binding protein [Clostridiales Family XIII bacterium]
MKIRKMLVSLLFLLTAVSLAACGNTAATTDVQTNADVPSTDAPNVTAELFPIKTATRMDCTLAPYIVAIEKGFFAEEGLELVWTGEIPDSETLTSVVTGVNDFHDAHPNQLALWVQGGAKVKAVGRSIIEPDPEKIGDTEHRLLHMWYYVNDAAWDAGVKTIADLNGYKSGTILKSAGWTNTCESFILETIFDRYNVPRANFEWIGLDSDTSKIEALKLGQVDIIGIHPPFYDAAEEAGLHKIADSWDAGLGEATGTYLYFFSDEFIAKNPDKVQAFVSALTKAQIWANAHKEETAALTGDFIGQEVKGNHYYSENTEIPEDGIKPWIDDLVKSGALKEGEIQVTDIVTHQFEVK